MVRCDAGVETQVQAVAKAASIAALEQFKISADRESLALRLSSNLHLLFPKFAVDPIEKKLSKSIWFGTGH